MRHVHKGACVRQVLLVFHPPRKKDAELLCERRAVTHHRGKIILRYLVDHHESQRPCVSGFGGIDEYAALTEKVTWRQTGEFGANVVLRVLDHGDSGPHDHQRGQLASLRCDYRVLLVCAPGHRGGEGILLVVGQSGEQWNGLQ